MTMDTEVSSKELLDLLKITAPGTNLREGLDNVLRAKTGISHWDITVRGGTLRVDVTDSDVKLTGAATLVADIDLL